MPLTPQKREELLENNIETVTKYYEWFLAQNPGRNPTMEENAVYWLDKFDQLLIEKQERIEKEKVKCPCGKYCVQEGRNEGLEDAINILKE